MNGEWIFQIALVLTSALVSALVGYLLGKRSQKLQIIREHVTNTVRAEYRVLFDEMRRNSVMLDGFLQKPNVGFEFPKLNKIYDEGLDELMKTHHKDLFLMVDSFRKNMLPKFNQLDIRKLMKRLYDISSNLLRESLPKEVVETSEDIARSLFMTIGQYYVIPDFLNERYDDIRNKIEKCIKVETSHVLRLKSERQLAFVIKRQSVVINSEEISQSLIEKVKPETESIINIYKELKEQNDKEVKDKLLPLLQKYISKPI